MKRFVLFNVKYTFNESESILNLFNKGMPGGAMVGDRQTGKILNHDGTWTEIANVKIP